MTYGKGAFGQSTGNNGADKSRPSAAAAAGGGAAPRNPWTDVSAAKTRSTTSTAAKNATAANGQLVEEETKRPADVWASAWRPVGQST